MIIGERLKHLRKINKMTIRELAERTGIAKSTISEIETQNKVNTTIETLEKLCVFFGVTSDYMIGKANQMDGVRKYDIPLELLDIGVQYLEVAKYMQNKKIPPAHVTRIIDMINEAKATD